MYVIIKGVISVQHCYQNRKHICTPYHIFKNTYSYVKSSEFVSLFFSYIKTKGILIDTQQRYGINLFVLKNIAFLIYVCFVVLILQYRSYNNFSKNL